MAGIAAIPAIAFGACAGLTIGITIGIVVTNETGYWWAGLLSGLASAALSACGIASAGIAYIFKDYDPGGNKRRGNRNVGGGGGTKGEGERLNKV
ncbi:hypothetical protein TrCOL_g574 [Triparma columacea]|uniref:Uncharacterized protein n=1 Tax=Triparma columacea TaxID=722753 RepID=A0A9W7L9A1_9STRA|nr:hypothetical protein TrCOL_g574 [Triparma columacea]